MIFFHGTNTRIHQLAAGTWLTADVYLAADFAQQRVGDNIICVLWCEESDVEFIYLPHGITPAYRLKREIPIIGMMSFDQPYQFKPLL